MSGGGLFAAGFLLSLSLCVDLGIVNLALIRTGLTRGMRPALALGLGSCVGDLVYAASSAWLVSLLLAHRPARFVLWLGGSTTLAWLAVKMLREAAPSAAHDQARQTGETAARPAVAGEFIRGAALALASPSAILWFAAVGGSVIAAHATGGGAWVPFFGGFALAGVLWSTFLAFLTGFARRRLDARFVRALALVSAALFCYFALRVFASGYREFVLAAPSSAAPIS